MLWSPHSANAQPGSAIRTGHAVTNAYTNCPICVPARASLATGRYVHQIGNWDNGHPYTGNTSSWHHRLREQGFNATSIGKLHFKGHGTDHGFTEEIEPLNVVDGIGDVLAVSGNSRPFATNDRVSERRTWRLDVFAIRPAQCRPRNKVVTRTSARRKTLVSVLVICMPTPAVYFAARLIRHLRPGRIAHAAAMANRGLAQSSRHGLFQAIFHI